VLLQLLKKDSRYYSYFQMEDIQILLDDDGKGKASRGQWDMPSTKTTAGQLMFSSPFLTAPTPMPLDVLAALSTARKKPQCFAHVSMIQE
jgi:hypothetical protein